METKFFTYLFLYFTIFSILRFIWSMISCTFSPKSAAEGSIRWLVRYGSILDLIHLSLAFILLKHDVGFYLSDFIYEGFAFDVYWDWKAFVFLSFSITVISLINHFSTVYLSGDPFYFKFFSMIYLLQLALVILILTRGNESIFIGWEFLGLSSVLLIAFYEYRSSVLKNSLIILAIYKTSDLLLYGALLYSAAAGIHDYHLINNPYCLISLLLACLIKSSVIPWFWLPKAVEGPTQSTAVFYGGLATHIPVYIFMRAWDIHRISDNYLLFSGLIFLILISVFMTSILSKIASDAKNSIAYATITQLGIIYLEVLLGFTLLATIHCLMHGFYRTMEFLRSPSILYEHQLIERGKVLTETQTGTHLSHLFPERLRVWVYNYAYNEFIFPRTLMYGVECFMGLFSSRINFFVIRTYLICSSLLLLFAELIAYFSARSELIYTDQLLLLLAYLLNLLAFLNKYRPKTFLAFLSASVLVSLIILSEKIYPMTLWFAIVGILVMVSVFSLTDRFRRHLPPVANFIGQMHRSNSFNFLLLIMGLSIVGMPGLGIFYIWSRLEHVLVTGYPNQLLLVYVLLTLNTIVFFRFYYVNFLGKHDLMEEIKAVQN